MQSFNKSNLMKVDSSHWSLGCTSTAFIPVFNMDAYNVVSVKVSGLALLKIIKHCEGETLLANEHVTGMLFGLVVGDTLEITNCCPLPNIPEDDQNMDSFSDYEAHMIKSMREVCLIAFNLLFRLIMITSP